MSEGDTARPASRPTPRSGRRRSATEDADGGFAAHAPVLRSRHVRSLQVVVDQAQEGRHRRQARQAVHEAGARDHRRRARGRGGPRRRTPTLATAIQKARDHSMPKDNIQRAIDRGTGEGADGVAIERILYEGYGPGGVAILVEALTDNRNRTGAEIRHAFDRHGGSLGEPGSVAWIFEKRGVILVDGDRYDEDDLIVAIDAGAEDVVDEDGDLLRVLTRRRATSPPSARRSRRPGSRSTPPTWRWSRRTRSRSREATPKPLLQPDRGARGARRRRRGPRQLRHPRGDRSSGLSPEEPLAAAPAPTSSSARAGPSAKGPAARERPSRRSAPSGDPQAKLLDEGDASGRERS